MFLDYKLAKQCPFLTSCSALVVIRLNERQILHFPQTVHETVCVWKAHKKPWQEGKGSTAEPTQAESLNYLPANSLKPLNVLLDKKFRGRFRF